jgi:hypothetical protein
VFLECKRKEQIQIETNLPFYFRSCYPNCCEILLCSIFEGVPTLGLTTASREFVYPFQQAVGDQTAVKLDGWLTAIS